VKACTYKEPLRRSGYTLLLFFTAANAAAPVAAVHGTVTNGVSGEGLRKSYASLTPVIGSTGSSYNAVTNDHGTFALEDVAPGNYNLQAECTGFLDGRYTAQLHVSGNENLTGIEIKMTPQAVLSGRVVDQDGDPWPHAGLSILHTVWRKGRKHVEDADASDDLQVNDQGEFRIAGLAPGHYYVLAEPDSNWEQQHHPNVNGQPAIRQQPTWYPSSPDIESSMPITLSAGQQYRGLEIRLRRGAGSNLHISGKVSGIADIPVPPGDPRVAQRRIWASRVSTVDVGDNFSGIPGPDGSFQLFGLSSGTYDVWFSQGWPRSTPLGRTTVQVDDRDVENLSIELHPPQTLRVIVRVDGSETAQPPRTPIYLAPVDHPGLDPYATTKADGSLDFADLGLGRYRVGVQDSFPGKVYLKLLRYGSVDSYDGTFALTSYGVPLEAVFSARGARLAGTILGKAAAPRVVLIPNTPDPTRREFETRTAVFDQNGVFTIEAIPPGSYKLCAFENVPEDIWLAPEFLKEIESSGVPIEATEGAASTIQLPLIGKKDTEPILAKLGID
jgi:hypothetical protein